MWLKNAGLVEPRLAPATEESEYRDGLMYDGLRGVFLPTWPCTILALHRPCTPRRGAVAYGTQHDLRDGGRLDRYSIPRVGVRHYILRKYKEIINNAYSVQAAYTWRGVTPRHRTKRVRCSRHYTASIRYTPTKHCFRSRPRVVWGYRCGVCGSRFRKTPELTHSRHQTLTLVPLSAPPSQSNSQFSCFVAFSVSISVAVPPRSAAHHTVTTRGRDRLRATAPLAPRSTQVLSRLARSGYSMFAGIIAGSPPRLRSTNPPSAASTSDDL